MSDTPRTDGFDNQQQQKPDRYDWATRYSYLLDFTRQLERECQKLSEEYDELWDEHKDIRAMFFEMELKLGQAENRIQPLINENEELRRTHGGGQTGVECAELAAQNNELRHQLGEALAMRLTNSSKP